jgi:hypothetical protein
LVSHLPFAQNGGDLSGRFRHFAGVEEALTDKNGWVKGLQ